ncbi:ABC-2 family transporter protein [Oxobacter pfennigii]|uniref:ABC-2 family transporter protein n=1 Tax=Oxobacter pfennigii TaxID=36849 RepID=A0A0P8YB42_9CLOT|nr:ABC transporter permease [Oxobacter pfennigii]KPU44258.1 ABC-2 family transporter protein [Oxobacter pfennigii]
MLSVIKLRLLRLRDDIGVFILMTVMAFGLTAIFGASLSGGKPEVIIVDEDKSGYSKLFIDELKDSTGFDFTEADMKNAVAKVEEGKALAALLINESFDTDIQNAEKITIGIMKIKDDLFILTLQELVSGIASKMAGSIRIGGYYQ